MAQDRDHEHPPARRYRRDGLELALRVLFLFLPRERPRLMGRYTAAFINTSDELGTLERGKVADLVVAAIRST
jgi:imidazolonepropionase-like amidohydrolase